jgi:hypothetical protein
LRGWGPVPGPGRGTGVEPAWFTGPVLAFTLGMVLFFALSIRLTSMRDEGEGARNFMVVMTAVFSALLVLQLAVA